MLKVSICIPNYRRAFDLLKVISDCEKQTVSPYEIIVQDDHSPQKEFNIIKKNISKNIIFNSNFKTIGIINNVNKVIKKAKGDYIVIVHNDDRLSNRYIEEICYWIEKHPSYNIYTTNGIGINQNEKIVGEFRLFPKNTSIKKGTGFKSIWQHDYFTFLSINGTTIYKSSLIKNNLFNKNFDTEADLASALKFLRKEDIFYIDKTVYFVGLHRNQESNRKKLKRSSLNKYIENCYRIYKTSEKDCKNVPFFMSKIKTMYALTLLIKYRYNIKEVLQILELNSAKEIASIFFLAPSLLLQFLIKKIRFLMNYSNIMKFHPAYNEKNKI